MLTAGHRDDLGVTWSNVETHTHLVAGTDGDEPAFSVALFVGDLDDNAIRETATAKGYEKRFGYTRAGMDIYGGEDPTPTIGVGNGSAVWVDGADPPVDGMDAIRPLFEARTSAQAETYAGANPDFVALTDALGDGVVTTGRTSPELSASATAGPYAPAVEGQVAGGYGVAVVDGESAAKTVVVFASEGAADADAVAAAVDGEATVSQSGRVVTAVRGE